MMAAAALTHHSCRSSCSSNLNRTSSSSLSPPYRPMIIIMAQQSPSFSDSINAKIDTHLKIKRPFPQASTLRLQAHELPHIFCTQNHRVGPLRRFLRTRRWQVRRRLGLCFRNSPHACTHENLPLTDRPTTRPKILHACRPNIELLTVDGFVPFGFELLAKSQRGADKVLRVIVEIRAVGSQGIVEVDGQYGESSRTARNRSSTSVRRRKVGSRLVAPHVWLF